MKLQAVIFDMDGLLVDSETVSAQAFQETAKLYNLTDVYPLFLSLVGCNERSHELILEKELGGYIDPIQFRKDWVHQYHEALKQGTPPLLPGAKDMLNWLQEANIPCAVATSSQTATAEKKLGDNDIQHYFQTITTGDDVEFSKPNPEIFLKAAASIDVNPALAWALEDSENGVRAAVSAGMQVIQIPNLVEPSDELRSLGHQVCGSLTEAQKILSLHA